MMWKILIPVSWVIVLSLLSGKNGEPTDEDHMLQIVTRDEGWNIIPKGQRDPSRIKRKATAYLDKRWTNKIVPYTFVPNTYSDSQISIIEDAVAEWRSYTCLDFKHWQDEDNYIYIGSYSRCTSRTGMKTTAESQSMSLSTLSGCVYKRVVLHEFGHAIGLHHEQTRPDRDEYVRIHFENIKEDRFSQFEKKDIDAVNYYNVPYDYTSIMHYGQTFSSKNGGITIETLDPAYQNVIGTAEDLSFRDVKIVNLMYDCADNCNTIWCPGEGFVGKDCKCWCPGNPVKKCGALPEACDAYELENGVVKYCYKNIDLTFPEAVAYCNLLSPGEYTVIKIDNANENDHVNPRTWQNIGTDYWIGANRANVNDEMRWKSDETVLQFNDWESGEPDSDDLWGYYDESRDKWQATGNTGVLKSVMCEFAGSIVPKACDKYEHVNGVVKYCYKNTDLTFSEAVEYCDTLAPGEYNVLKIDNADENDHMNPRTWQNIGMDYWIGAYRVDVTAEMRWISDDTVLQFNDWESGEPDSDDLWSYYDESRDKWQATGSTSTLKSVVCEFAGLIVPEACDAIEQVNGIVKYCYKDTDVTFSEAVEYCDTLAPGDYNVIKIDNANENENVNPRTWQNIGNEYWIGAYRVDVNAEMRWISDDSVVQFNDWRSGEPDSDDLWGYYHESRNEWVATGSSSTLRSIMCEFSRPIVPDVCDAYELVSGVIKYCYKNTDLTFSEAVEYCNALTPGKYSVIKIDNANENYYINPRFWQNIGTEYWIGAYRVNVDTDMRWISDDSVVQFDDWGSGEPDSDDLWGYYKESRNEWAATGSKSTLRGVMCEFTGPIGPDACDAYELVNGIVTYCHKDTAVTFAEAVEYCNGLSPGKYSVIKIDNAAENDHVNPETWQSIGTDFWIGAYRVDVNAEMRWKSDGSVLQFDDFESGDPDSDDLWSYYDESIGKWKATGRTSVLKSIMCEIVVPIGYNKCDAFELENGVVKYCFKTTDVTFAEAVEYCNGLSPGEYRVIKIDNANENDHINPATWQNIGLDYWIGATRSDVNVEMRWISDDTSLQFDDWESGDPDSDDLWSYYDESIGKWKATGRTSVLKGIMCELTTQ